MIQATPLSVGTIQLRQLATLSVPSYNFMAVESTFMACVALKAVKKPISSRLVSKGFNG